MTTVPSQAQLQAAEGQEFQFEDEAGRAVPGTLLAVHDGIAMDERHTCYSAVFRLPAGVGVGQGTYRVRDPQDRPWEIFMTPQLPGPDGHPRLQAVFHHDRAETAQS